MTPRWSLRCAALYVNRFDRKALPERFCNLERLLAAMTARGLDGIVVSTPLNVFYLSGFNGIAHKADEPRPYAVLLSRHAPDHPILVLADYYLATVLSQPTWVRDIRPFRAVMMPIDRAPQRADIDQVWRRPGRGRHIHVELLHQRRADQIAPSREDARGLRPADRLAA